MPSEAGRTASSRDDGLKSADLVIATAADLPAVVELMNLAYRGRVGGAGWSNAEPYLEGDRINLQQLQADLAAKPNARVLLWRRGDGSLRGSAWLELRPRHMAYLGSLAISPREQKAGQGRKMLEALEAWAMQRGAREVRMTVINVRTALIEWYGRRGYRPTGETEPFPYGDLRYGRPMRDDLCFNVLRKPLPANEGRSETVA